MTGATGKVGRPFIDRLLGDARYDRCRVRALCHKRELPPHPRIESVRGSIQHRADVGRAMEGVTHVLHLATSKETPDEVMDVAVKGMFWLLEECRASTTFRQFLLVGGDAAVGHFSTRAAPLSSRASRTAPIPGVMRSPRCWRK